MSCLQPCVHPQPSVCGEYDGKFPRPLSQLTQQTPAGYRFNCASPCASLGLSHTLDVTCVSVCTGFGGLVPVSVSGAVCVRQQCYLTLGLPNTSCVNSILRFAFGGYCVLCHLLEPHGGSLTCVCVFSPPPPGDPGAGESRGDVHHPGRGRLAAVHPGSVSSCYHISACVLALPDYTPPMAASAARPRPCVHFFSSFLIQKRRQLWLSVLILAE